METFFSLLEIIGLGTSVLGTMVRGLPTNALGPLIYP